jgi:hypothetical protein
MKTKNILFALLSNLFILPVFSQVGLEGIVVEKYYISDAADSMDAANNGAVYPLGVGSVTYRVYANLLPGYKVIQMFGNNAHTLNIATTTSFYNDPNYGFKVYQGTSLNNTKKNTTLIDSYVTIGGVANGLMGVLKTEDSDGTIGNLQNILANTDPLIGLPITGTGAQDGLMPGTPTLPNVLGITSELDLFDQTAGNDFTTNGAAIAALGGVEGVTTSNHVLLGQFTTDGVFSFHLNIQLSTPVPGESQIFVSDSAETNEFLDTTLNYTSEVVIDNSGIEEIQSIAPSFILHPNPSQNSIAIKSLNNNLSGSEIYDVQIIDMSGRTVINKIKHSLVDSINVTGLNDGIYTLKLTNGKETSSLRLVKF